MKKTIITIYAVAITSFILYAQTQEKQLTVTLPTSKWQLIVDCLNKSREEYVKVIEAQNLILPQLQKQLSDTTTKKK